MSVRRLLLAAGALLVTTACMFTVAVSSRAAWTDESRFAAVAEGGDWTPVLPAFRCYSVDYHHPDAECEVVTVQWLDDPGFYALQFDVTTDHPEPFRWAVRFNLASDDTTLPGGAAFPPWAAGSAFNLVGLCAHSTDTTLPVAEVRGWQASLPSDDELVSSARPVTNRQLQVYPPPPGGGSQWGTGDARDCPPLPPPPGVLYCYSVTPGVDALCDVEVETWEVTADSHTADFHVTTTSAAPFEWEVWLDYSIPPTDPEHEWPEWQPVLFESADICSVWTNSELPQAFGRGRGEHATVSAGDPTDTLSFVSHPAGAGVGAELGDPTNLCNPALDDAPVRCRIPEQPWIPCTATLTTGSGWQRQFRVTTPSTIGVEWEVRVNASSTAFPFVPSRMSSFGALRTVAPVDCAADERVVRVAGAHAWNRYVRNDQPQEPTIVGETWNDGQLFVCP